ncbi:alanine racemase [Leucobacter ruminantium]|uniref:Alanine racemase n=1 Tax=Leucobacter ruminantium TaxID=1289170 RepID=A0A939LTV0_9MICO|nr:alanine racemase [Leucobacter ruminantium]MBO1804251.1 alanine racemase [Leucobacter ruminantium]
MTALFREAVIDADAISANVAHVAGLTGVEVIGVVKANGYGHGAMTVARAALEGGARRIGVADIGEALALRAEGLEAPLIAWLHGAGASFAEAAEHGIELGVSSIGQLAAAADAARAGRPTRVHIKLDTGLSRNGAAPEEWEVLFAEAARLEAAGSVRVAGIFSHLANTTPESNREALGEYLTAVALAESLGVHPETRHLAATHGTFELPEARLDAVRLGIGMYGLSPFDGVSSAELGLRPAMTLRAGVAKVRRVPAGAGVSYDHTYRTERETTLALVPLGYADGVPRQASSRGPVLLNGERYTVAGRVAMDQLVLDVGDAPVAEGDVATLFGDPATGAPSATEWADAAGTINYEIVTRIGHRVPRVPA